MSTLSDLTDEQVHEIAVALYRREMFMGIEDNEVKYAFSLVLGLMKPEHVPDNAVALIGEMSETIPGRALNGYPIFTSARFVTEHDVRRIAVELHRIEEVVG